MGNKARLEADLIARLSNRQAVNPCDMLDDLLAKGHRRLDIQLAAQAAIDRGDITVDDNLCLVGNFIPDRETVHGCLHSGDALSKRMEQPARSGAAAA